MSSNLESFIKSNVLSKLKHTTFQIISHNGQEIETSQKGEKIVTLNLIYKDGSNSILEFINDNGTMKFNCKGVTPVQIATISDINYDLVVIEQRVINHSSSLQTLII